MRLYIFGVLILLVIGFFVLAFIPIPFTGPNIQATGPYDLNKSNDLALKNTTNFLTNNSTSLQGFIYLDTVQRTGIQTPQCSTTDTSLPNCNTGRYSLCKCNGSDCTNCYHNNNNGGYIPIINICGKTVLLEALGAPDASRQGDASVQLTIKTQSSGKIADNSGNTFNPVNNAIDASGAITSDDRNSAIYIETFVLPPLPFQKWVMITISREGRRFDIYYNKTLVLSKLASAVLYTSPADTTITVGNTMLNGSAGFFNLYDNIQSVTDIQKEYVSFTNTRGTPLFTVNPPTLGEASMDSTIGTSSYPMLCPSGDCINTPKTPPANPLYSWTSNYA